MGTFKNCTSLKEIVIPDSVASIESDDFDGPFYGCENLERVKIGSSVKSLPNSLFKNCQKLNNIEFSDSIKTLGNYVFSNTGIESISLPDSIISIGDWVFSECKNLVYVKLPVSIKKVGWGFFYNCNRLSSFPDGLNEIGSFAFYGCNGLNEITIKKDVSYGDHCFGGIYLKTRVIVEDGIESFNFSIFAIGSTGDESSFTNITLPPSVKEIKGEIACNIRILTIESPSIINNVKYWNTVNTLQCLQEVYTNSFSDIKSYFDEIKILDTNEILKPKEMKFLY